MNKITALTANESRRLTELEITVKAGKETFVKVGLALAEIRNSRLYRRDFGTFEDYCRDKWGFTRQYANQIIAGANVVKSLPANLESTLSNPRQATALVQVPPRNRIEVLQAVKSAGPITAKSIAETAKRIIPPRLKTATAHPDTLDSTGIPVPPEILGLWNSAFERAQKLLTFTSEIRSEIRRAQDEHDLVFREVDHTDILAKLDQVFVDLKRAKPYAVCADCNGVKTKGCIVCRERGFVSEFYWTHSVSEETKKITGREEKEAD